MKLKTRKNHRAQRRRTAKKIETFLSFVASPLFLLLGAVTEWNEPDGLILCSVNAGGLRWHGMSGMYAVMSALHLAPWIHALLMRRLGEGKPKAMAKSRVAHTDWGRRADPIKHRASRA